MVSSRIYSNLKEELTKFNIRKLYLSHVLPKHSLPTAYIWWYLNSNGWSVTQQKTRFPILHIPIVLVVGGIWVAQQTKGSNRATFPQVSLYCLYFSHPQSVVPHLFISLTGTTQIPTFPTFPWARDSSINSIRWLWLTTRMQVMDEAAR